MFRFVTSLFGCAHSRCTFPITLIESGRHSNTYVVCLDCGREFDYDWERMKVASARQSQGAVA